MKRGRVESVSISEYGTLIVNVDNDSTIQLLDASTEESISNLWTGIANKRRP